MNEYETIAVYVVFALIIFAGGMVWNRIREDVKKRFHLLNYHSKSDDTKSTTLVHR